MVPEGVAKIENIEELLNGIKDFTEGQKEVDGARGALSEFMEDVALATDADNDTGDDDRVALMTIHLAKGLEFPYVFIVGMEEDLFPSAMSMSTRSELEERTPVVLCGAHSGRETSVSYVCAIALPLGQTH
jgi:DNA helicase-2/ATP-dependent DNA helicase PcrA